MERDGDSVGMEDLDSLQLELESLLSSVVVSIGSFGVGWEPSVMYRYCVLQTQLLIGLKKYLKIEKLLNDKSQV